MKALTRIAEMQVEAHTLIRRLDMLARIIEDRNGPDLPFQMQVVRESVANLDDHSDALPEDTLPTMKLTEEG